MKNKKLNDILKNRAEEHNEKYWNKRVGKCDPTKCSSACCRFFTISSYSNDEYHDLASSSHKGTLYSIKKYKKKEVRIYHNNCKYMAINGRCKLHNKKKQPYTCNVFPMHIDDATYQIVKKYCGYKFVKIKNKKYKKGIKKGVLEENVK